MENSDLEKKAPEQPKTITEITPVDVLGAVIPIVTPGDRIPPEESGKAPFKLPGPGNLKDIPGGPVGIIKGIFIDNAKQILGAQPLSSGDQKVYAKDIIFDAAYDIVTRQFKPGFQPYEFPLLTDSEKYLLRQYLRDNPRIVTQLEATAAGSDFLKAAGIKQQPRGAITSAALSILRPLAPAKRGGTVGFRPAVPAAATSVVGAITELARLLAANPGDP